ncbi:hypothetical protein STAN_6982 [Streptomyces sp. CBMAI 2042]|nr:hypothetical protein STAN_6982 [Streptomyces sp. CBMAI 2042]
MVDTDVDAHAGQLDKSLPIGGQRVLLHPAGPQHESLQQALVLLVKSLRLPAAHASPSDHRFQHDVPSPSYPSNSPGSSLSEGEARLVGRRAPAQRTPTPSRLPAVRARPAPAPVVMTPLRDRLSTSTARSGLRRALSRPTRGAELGLRRGKGDPQGCDALRWR